MKKIFYNGDILTMEDTSSPEAILIHNDIIEKLGDFDELTSYAPDAQLIDLAHKTLLPSFIDAHSHFSSYANSKLWISLEGSASFDEISARINLFISSNNIEAGKWLVANGYDHNNLPEKSHPSRQMLDDIAPNNPLILQHKSGHCGVLNSKAFELLDITIDTPIPSGGVIGQENGQLTGYMEEEAYINAIKRVPLSDLNELLGAYRKAQKSYLSYGITTVQDGMMVAQMLPLYQALLASDILEVDIVGYSDMNSMKKMMETFPNSVKNYNNHFKIGGYKIFLDGSPQVKTAWMKTPYKDDDNYFGYGTMSDAAVFSAVEKTAKENFQILAHCNGDAAIQQYIDAIYKVSIKNKNVTDLRPVIIHSQLLAKTQLVDVAKLNMIPSFFIAHVLHWGDIHIENFGYDRASMISPAKSALEKNIIFTFHQDAPVIEPNMLETVQCAVTRKTKSDLALGKDECISVIDALKAITINVAYQYSEENIKGSLKEGKQANIVILSDNPLMVEKEKIADIEILETIKEGKTLYTKP